MTDTEPRPHPCTWSTEVLLQLRDVFRREHAHQDGRDLVAYDPFAGPGLEDVANVMPDGWFAVGTELEPEWACQSPGTLVADATRPPLGPGTVDVLVTSPTYGNRFADTYDGQNDRCTAAGCGKDGAPEGWRPVNDDDEIEDTDEVDGPDGDTVVVARCSTCGGTGRSPSKRYTYRIALGRMPSEGSTTTLKWRPGPSGAPYRHLHGRAWAAAWELLKPGGLVVVNVSNSIETVGPKHARREVEHHVSEWHLMAFLRLGGLIREVIPVPTRRMKNGANSTSRTENEWLLVLRKPKPIPRPPKTQTTEPEES